AGALFSYDASAGRARCARGLCNARDLPLSRRGSGRKESRPVEVTSRGVMSNDRLIRLCEKLNSGDAAAAEEVFLSYEPYLRMVVGRQITPKLRAKFDSIDVVQSVWANVLLGFREASWKFDDEAQLRSFLIRLTLNRFISFYRQHRTSVEREQPLTGR